MRTHDVPTWLPSNMTRLRADEQRALDNPSHTAAAQRFAAKDAACDGGRALATLIDRLESLLRGR